MQSAKTEAFRALSRLCADDEAVEALVDLLADGSEAAAQEAVSGCGRLRGSGDVRGIVVQLFLQWRGIA